MKKLGCHKKVGGQHKCLSCMLIFGCNEDWFAIINPIKPNMTCEDRQNRRQKVFKSFRILLAECYLLYYTVCQSNEREITHKAGGHGPPSPAPLELPTQHNSYPNNYIFQDWQAC